MNRANHIAITQQALAGYFSPRAMAAILEANLGQDQLRYQFGHSHFHFDNNQLAAGLAYIEEQQEQAVHWLCGGQTMKAWQAFGRLVHAGQDFYAHTTYVRMWVAHYPKNVSPEAIEPLDPALLADPALYSGRVAYLWEAFSLLPGLGRVARRLAPPDTHTYLNLDAPDRGPLFAWAFAAARKRTRYEFDQLMLRLPPEQRENFQDRTR